MYIEMIMFCMIELRVIGWLCSEKLCDVIFKVVFILLIDCGYVNLMIDVVVVYVKVGKMIIYCWW